jgi:membrane-associated phospholipid phosphatase
VNHCAPNADFGSVVQGILSEQRGFAARPNPAFCAPMQLPEQTAEPAEQGAARISGRDHILRNWVAVVGLGVIALLAFAKLGEDVFEHETTVFDSTVRAWTLAHRWPPLTSFFQVVTTVGSVTPMVCYAVVGALLLWYRGRPFVASTILVAPAAAVAAYLILKNMFARSRPSGLGNILEGTYSFPSAHATSSAAICCTLAYVFWRERLVNGGTAFLIAIFIPVLVGASRVYLDVHWTTDILGGWSAGVLVAALSAALYHSNRHLQSRRSREGVE